MRVLNKIITNLFGINQVCKFIGRNHSTGLINGNLYELKIMFWKTNGIQITWHDRVLGCMWCPYSSVNNFLENWELCCAQERKLVIVFQMDLNAAFDIGKILGMDIE